MYGVYNKAFKSLVFCEDLTIVFDYEDTIDYTAVKDFVDGKFKDSFNICKELLYNIETNTFVLCGYRISKSLYITSAESDSYYSLPSPLEKKDVHTLLYYLYHMHVTV